MANLTAPSVSRLFNAGWMMNSNRSGRKRLCPWRCFRQDSRCSNRYSQTATPEYKSFSVTHEPARSSVTAPTVRRNLLPPCSGQISQKTVIFRHCLFTCNLFLFCSQLSNLTVDEVVHPWDIFDSMRSTLEESSTTKTMLHLYAG